MGKSSGPMDKRHLFNTEFPAQYLFVGNQNKAFGLLRIVLLE